MAITGSQGKTVTKRALYALLAKRFRVRANPLSYNTAVGLPLAVLGCELDTRHPLGIARGFANALWAGYLDRTPVDVMVLELGIRQPGDLRAHFEIVRPDIAIVTPLVPSFSEDSDALAALRREIATLCAEGSRPGMRALLLCADDAFLADLAAATPGATPFAMSDFERSDGRLALRVDGESWPVGRDTVGASSFWALSAAVRVGRLLGMSDAEIRDFLAGR